MAIQIGGTTVIDDSRDINAGVITATSFSGDGSNLTGVGIGSTGDINTTGIITAYAVYAEQFEGFGDDLVFSPSITSFSPTDGATDVNPGTNIVLTFDQQIYAGVGSIFLRNSSGIGTVIEAIGIGSTTQITISNQTLTINPSSNLPDSTDVYVVLPQGVIVNSVGANISSVSTYNFTIADVPELGETYEGGCFICQASGVRWIAAPVTATVSRTWYARNDANTVAQQVSGCTGWFVPSCGQAQNPGYTCSIYWYTFTNALFWTSTEFNSTGAYNINFNNGSTANPGGKTRVDCVRSFRCVSY